MRTPEQLRHIASENARMAANCPVCGEPAIKYERRRRGLYWAIPHTHTADATENSLRKCRALLADIAAEYAAQLERGGK